MVKTKKQGIELDRDIHFCLYTMASILQSRGVVSAPPIGDGQSQAGGYNWSENRKEMDE